MKYKSTRGDKTTYTFSEAILKGIAPDGGLLVPDKFPSLSQKKLEKLVQMSYQDLATFIFSTFIKDEFTKEEIQRIVKETYSAHNFDSEQIAPVQQLDNQLYIQELWHGPTAAFKDMALQIMPRFFSTAIDKTNQDSRYLILVATSGDTGSAALYGFANTDKTQILAFFPQNGISPIQERQMTTIDKENTFAIAARGDFDVIQSNLKKIFNDISFNDKLKNKFNIRLSSANSINWGRLLPQIVYHFYGYFQLVKVGDIKLGDEIDIVVPSANFGNLLAASYAKEIGLPVQQLVCASNENNVLEEFIKTGTYNITKRSLLKTPSPSMDIIISSNLERLLYSITKSTKKIGKWMTDLSKMNKYTVDEKTKDYIQKFYKAYSSTNQESLDYISKTYEDYNYLVDTHTAIGIHAAIRLMQETNRPAVVSSTAHWSKFPEDVYKAINKIPLKKDLSKPMKELMPYELLDAIELETNSDIHWFLKQIRSDKVSQDQITTNELEDMKSAIESVIHP